MESGASEHHAQHMGGFLGCKHMLQAHGQFVIHLYLPALLLRAVLNPIIIYTAECLTQVQGLALVELYGGFPLAPRDQLVFLYCT